MDEEPKIDYYTKFNQCIVVGRLTVYEDCETIKERVWLKGHHYFPGALFIPKGKSGGPETEVKVVTAKHKKEVKISCFF